MKKRHAFLSTAVFLLVLFVSGIWFQTHRLLPSGKLHEILAQKIQTLTEGTLKYQDASVDYFPQPRIVFVRPQLTFSDRPMIVKAESIQFDFNILPLLLGRTEPSAFYVQSGEMEFSVPGLSFVNPVRFENFSLQIGAVVPKIAIPFHLTSDVAGKPGVFIAKGNVTLDSVEKWDWEKLSGSMIVELRQLSLVDAIQKGPVPKRDILFKGGQIDASVEIKKKAKEDFLELTALGTAKGLAYEVFREKTWVVPPVLDAEWNVSAAWNNDTSELKLHKGTLKLPFGVTETNGSMKLNTGEIAGAHISGENMALEDLLKYCPGLENALPFHMGFSGPVKWVLSLDGTLDHLSLHFDLELGQVLLSYGQYFTKPKDLPLDLNFDLLLQNGATLGGDFAVRFKELSMKGNLKDLNLKTGAGQLNLITNKFSMTGWEQYIPVLQDYKLEGDAKLMSNWKGDLRKLEKAEHIFNLTFDKASLTVPSGEGVRNASLSLDYSPLMLEGRQMQFEIGGFPIGAELKVSGGPEKPQVTAKISAENLKPVEVVEAVTALFKRKGETAVAPGFGLVKDFVAANWPKGKTITKVVSEIRYEGGVWDLPLLQLEAYGGKADLKGMLNCKEKEPSYRLEGEFLGVDLGLFLSRQEGASKALEGSLNLKGTLEGNGWGAEAWSRSLKGQGDFTLSKGKFLTFDLSKSLATIEPLKGLETLDSDLKGFDTMNFQWKISEGKAVTDNLLVKARDYVVDGEGTLGFDGLANFRMEVFLSSALAPQLLPQLVKPFEKNPQAHFGPIPTLLSGPFLAPDLKLEPSPMEALTAKIRKGKAKDFLIELVTE